GRREGFWVFKRGGGANVVVRPCAPDHHVCSTKKPSRLPAFLLIPSESHRGSKGRLLSGAIVSLALLATSCIPRVKAGAATGSAGGASSGQTQAGPAAPAVRVNQVGYLTSLPKRATVRSDSTTPLPWELRGANGAAILKGTTTVLGDDPA